MRRFGPLTAFLMTQHVPLLDQPSPSLRHSRLGWVWLPAYRGIGFGSLSAGGRAGGGSFHFPIHLLRRGLARITVRTGGRRHGGHFVYRKGDHVKAGGHVRQDVTSLPPRS